MGFAIAHANYGRESGATFVGREGGDWSVSRGGKQEVEWYNRVVQPRMQNARNSLKLQAFLNVAVKERFELSIQFLVYTLSRRAP
jgi:hypothetical protein